MVNIQRNNKYMILTHIFDFRYDMIYIILTMVNIPRNKLASSNEQDSIAWDITDINIK